MNTCTLCKREALYATDTLWNVVSCADCKGNQIEGIRDVCSSCYLKEFYEHTKDHNSVEVV